MIVSKPEFQVTFIAFHYKSKLICIDKFIIQFIKDCLCYLRRVGSQKMIIYIVFNFLLNPQKLSSGMGQLLLGPKFLGG